jgi:hypothetical protein
LFQFWDIMDSAAVDILSTYTGVYVFKRIYTLRV